MVRPVVPTTPHRTPTSSRGPPTSTSSATSTATTSTTATTTTPKAYKWRQPSHDDDDDDGEQAHPSCSCSWPHSHSSASPTDVRQLQPLQPLQYPLTPHSEASVSASASTCTEPGASRSSSLATAAPHEDDSSIDSKSPLVSYHHSTIHANYNGTPLLTSKTALPPLGTDSSDNDTDEEHHHHHYLRDYYNYRDYSGAPHLSNSEISSTVPPPPVVVDEHRPPHPQHEEQHPCKKLQPEVDVHPSKKRDEKPQQLQQPLELHEQYSARLLPRASEASGVSGALLECVQLAAAQWYEESLDKEEFWETSNNNSSSAGAGSDKKQDTTEATTISTKKSTLNHAPSSLLMQEEEEAELAGEPSASLASLQEELAIAEKSFESSESLSVLLQPPSMEDENDDYHDYNDNPPKSDNNNNKPQQQQQQPSGYSMVGGTWKDSPADLVLFLDDDEDDNDGEHHPNDANLSGFSNSSVESSIVILHSTTTTTTTTTTDDTNSSQDAQATAREEIIGKKTAPQNNNSGRKIKEIAVAPRDPSLEGSRTVSGNWNEDLQATRLEFVDDNNNSNDVIQQSLHQSLQEIRVPPRNSKPVVLRGDLLKEYMNSAELIFRSKDDLHLVIKPSQSSSSTSSTLASAAARKRTLQRKSLPRHHDVTVQPPVSSSSSSHGFFAKPQNSVQNNNSNDSTNSNTSSSTNNHNHHREINVQPRRSKPLVLKGDLKEYMENAKLLYQSGRDDFHVLTPSMLSKSKPRQQPKPFAVQNNNNNNNSNKSPFLSQHSEPTVLSSNRRNHLHMLVDDEDDKNRPENTCAKSGERNEIKVEPRRSKPVVLRGNLKEYMQNTDLIFQSKDDLHIVPQLQRKLSRDEILVEPQAVENRILSDTQVHDILPLDDTEAEIQVEPRRLKPFVLRGNLKEYMATAHLHFRSKDDLDVMPRFQRQNQQQQQSQTEITVEPLDCEIRRVLSNDVSEIMPLNDEDNEIIVKARRSKPFVLRGDLKEYMDTADLIFRSDDDWAVMDKRRGGAVAEEKTEILVEPREGESIAVSGDLKDYVQNAAKVFHESVLDSARVYQDTIEATKSEIKDIDDDDVEEEDEILATKSIDSLREELALADQSFDLQHSAASMMSAETVPIANLVHGTSVKILSHPTMVKRQHQKTIYLPFPWSTPELLFVPHNELRPPPEAVQCYLPQPVLEEKMMELDFRKKRARKQDAEADKEVVLESVPMSCNTIPPHEVEASLPPPQPTEPSCEMKDTLPPSAPPEPPPLSDDILSQSKKPEPPSKHRESLTFVSGDVAVLYRGTKPPPSSRRKRPSSFLSTLVRPFSSARSSSMDDYFCVDCGGPTIRCYCEAVIEKEQQRASRMESVYSIDVGNIVSDASAKFIMVRPPGGATKKTKDPTKKKLEHTGKSLDTSGEKQTSTLPPSSKPPKQHIADRNDPPPEPDPLATEAPSKISRSLSVKERNLLVPMPPDSKPAEAIHPEPLDSSMAEGKNEDDPLPPDSSKVEGNHMPDLEPSDCSTSESGTKVETSTSRTRKIGNTTRKDSPDPSQSPRSSPHRLSSSSRDRELAPLTVLKIGKAVIGSDVEDPPPPKGKQIKTKKKKKILRGIRKKVGRFMKRLGGSTKASF